MTFKKSIISVFLFPVFFFLFLDLALTNPIQDYSLTSSEQHQVFNFFVEIPAGTNQKWEVDKASGELGWEIKDGVRRTVKFLPYPGNYGFLPQTMGGDDDPLDVIDLEPSSDRGVIKATRIIGGMYFKDGKDEDVKLIGISPDGIFSSYLDISTLLLEKPAALELVKLWFESYKKPGKMIFYKYLSLEESLNLIAESHKRWVLGNPPKINSN